MIRMIIVDDEYIILDSLKTLLDWKSIGVEVVGTADNGAAAIDLTIKQRPDIILSDISMPCFSGLQMLETLRRNNIHTEVIFITAYGKFEYAQEAIHYGAFDYILKPINEEDLLATVSRCAAGILAKQCEQEIAERHHDLILERLIQGKFPEKTEWDVIKTQGFNYDIFPYALVIGFRHEKDNAPGLDAACFHASWVSLPLRAAEGLTLFMICFPDKSMAEWSAFISRRIHHYPDMVIAVSSPGDLRDCFEKAYAQIAFALIDADVHRRKGMILFDNLKKSGRSSFAGFDDSCSLMSQSVREGKTEQAEKLLYGFFTGFLQKDILYDSSLVELYCIELADHVYRENADYIYPSGKDGEMPFIMDSRKRLAACSGLHQMFDALCGIMLDLYNSINKDQTHSSLRLVRQCIRIIHEHYREDISLSNAAKQLYVSPNYLSKIFSAEMGKSFSRYLLEYRVSMAKNILKESNEKVYEIAERVGYTDVVHFSKIFKQITGMSPNHYRNRK